jgi:hypothetical protein
MNYVGTIERLRRLVMFMNRTNLLGMLIVPLLSVAQASGQEKSSQQAPDEWASKLLAEKFDDVHKLIKPQRGESRWREIPWLTSLWEARVKAAAEGKPIVVWTGSGGAPACHT